MSPLFPLGWLFLSLIPVIIFLYLRKVQRQRLIVPTLLFWERAAGEKQQRAFLGKLRQWLSLLLQLIILLLLILSLVRPEREGGTTGGHSTVIILDTRARMKAIEPDGKTRFEKALLEAKRLAGSTREGASIALLAAGPQPEVLAPFSDTPPSLEKAAATDASGDLAVSVKLAKELLATRPGSHRIILITDGSDAPKEEGLEVIAVGSPLENVGITRFAARPEISSPQTASLLLTVQNFGKSSADGNVEVSSEGRLLDVRPYQLAPGESKTALFPALPTPKAPSFSTERPKEERLTAKWVARKADPFPNDDIAYALLSAPASKRVLLVSSGNWFLEKLLSANPAIRFEMLAPEAFQPSMGAGFDVVIYDGQAPPLDQLTGNALFLNASPFGTTGALSQPMVTDFDAAHPLLRRVEWANVAFLKASKLTAPEKTKWQTTTPLRSFDDPLIFTTQREGQRLAVFGFDLAETDLPLRVAFPLLISNTLQWLADGDLNPLPSSLDAGAPLPLAPTETAQREGSSGPPSKGLLQPMENGFYTISPAPERLVAVNTFSTLESNLLNAPAAPPSLLAPLATLSVPLQLPWWQWLALAALALLSLEWWTFHRRHTE